jgi:hypothetical protein
MSEGEEVLGHSVTRPSALGSRSSAPEHLALRAARDKLPEHERERDAILAAVKADNPGLTRFRKLLEPLYLAALEARLNGVKQKTLFDAE